MCWSHLLGMRRGVGFGPIPRPPPLGNIVEEGGKVAHKGRVKGDWEIRNSSFWDAGVLQIYLHKPD